MHSFCWPQCDALSCCMFSWQLPEQLVHSLCCSQSFLTLHPILFQKLLLVSCVFDVFFFLIEQVKKKTRHLNFYILPTAQNIISSSPQDLDHCLALVLQMPIRWLCSAPSRQPPALAVPRGPGRLLHPQPSPEHVQANQSATESPRAQGVALQPSKPPEQGAVARHHPLDQQDR